MLKNGAFAPTPPLIHENIEKERTENMTTFAEYLVKKVNDAPKDDALKQSLIEETTNEEHIDNKTQEQ